jgi:hypothetical protein
MKTINRTNDFLLFIAEKRGIGRKAAKTIETTLKEKDMVVVYLNEQQVYKEPKPRC